MDLLSELRPVTCIFVQLQLAAGTSSVHLSTVLKEASRVMLEILSPHKGHINKVLLCDKVSGGERWPPPAPEGGQ